MASSTGPILAAGGITWANTILLGENKGDPYPPTFRIAFGTAIAAGILALVEKATKDVAVALSYAALLSVFFVRVGNAPTPVERLLSVTKF